MSLLEKINKEDICKVIAYSQNIENPQVDKLLDNWDRQKTRMAKTFFNGEVRYVYPDKVRFELSDDSKTERYNSFIDFLWRIFNEQPHPLTDFVCRIGVTDFYSNSLSTEYVIKERDNKKISSGSKVIKAFKYFIDDELLLHDLQNRASEIIQENKVEGYLTFSIHPLDFLSSSENTYNWRSCHSLDGEYRAGNLSYIGDRSTMMVYLSSGKDEKLPNFPGDVLWNSKKWRLLLHFDNNLEACFAGRQYPFYSPGALEKVKEIFDKELAPVYDKYLLPWEDPKRQEWEGWYNDYVTNFLRVNGEEVDIDDGQYCVINRGVFNISDIVKDAENSRHFNDVLRSSCYTKPYYMFRKFYSPHRIEIEVGSEAPCLRCEEYPIVGGSTMMCNDCECNYGTCDSEDYRTCDCCGGRRWHEDGDWVGDEWLCDDCLDTETFICPTCHERYYNSDRRWDDRTQQYLCEYCFRERNEL